MTNMFRRALILLVTGLVASPAFALPGREGGTLKDQKRSDQSYQDETYKDQSSEIQKVAFGGGAHGGARGFSGGERGFSGAERGSNGDRGFGGDQGGFNKE